MKSILIILVLSFPFSLFAESFKPIDVIVVWGKELDKEKRELYKKLKVKSVTSIQKNFALDIDSPNRVFSTYSFFDENGNETRFEHENEFDPKFDYEEEYVTDSLGNILEAYRDGRLIARQTFDKNGNMLSKKLYDDNKNVDWDWSYEYDVNGNLVLELENFTYLGSDTIKHYKYEYLFIGNKVLLKSKLSIIDDSKILYSYDSLGREINYKEYDKDGELFYLKSKDFNSLQGISIIYNSDNTIYITDSITINIDLQPVFISQYGSDGRLIAKIIYEYTNGIITSLTRLTPNDSIISQTLYNREGKELSYKYFVNGQEMSTAFYEYYENSLLKSEIHFNYKNNENRSIEYEYDYYE